MGLEETIKDFRWRLGRDLTKFEDRMIRHAWVNGVAHGVVNFGIKEDFENER